MSEENNNQDQATEPQQQGQEPEVGTIDPSAVRQSKLFLQQAQRAQEAEKKLAEYEKSLNDKRVEEERKRLEEQGQYQEILKQKEDELIRTQQQFERTILEKDLANSLIRAGADKVMTDWAIAKFSGTAEDIEEYVNGLATDESNAKYFGSSEPTGQSPPAGVVPGTRSANKSLQERLADDDPKVRSAARREVFLSR